MRRILLCVLTLALAACSPDEPPPETAAEGCARSAAQAVTWTSDAAPDTVTATSTGPSCAQAIVTLVFRDAQGDPLWVFASTHYDMSVGGRSTEMPPVSAEEMDRFLASWAEVTVNRSGDLPEWREGAASPGESADALAYGTAFDRESYEALRARSVPQVCFAAAIDATQCLVIDPHSGAPTVIVAVGA